MLGVHKAFPLSADQLLCRHFSYLHCLHPTFTDLDRANRTVVNMAAWQPNPESLKTLAACLKDSLSGFNKTAQKQAEQVGLAAVLVAVAARIY